MIELPGCTFSPFAGWATHVAHPASVLSGGNWPRRSDKTHVLTIISIASLNKNFTF